jgi:hypothetical protein
MKPRAKMEICKLLLRTNQQTNKQTKVAGRQACKHPEQINVRLDKSCEPMSDLVGHESTYYCVRRRIIVLKKKERNQRILFFNCVGERSGLKPCNATNIRLF